MKAKQETYFRTVGWPLYLITPSGHVKGNSEKGALRLANESYAGKSVLVD